MADRPRVIIHNTISLDGQLTGFPVDLGLHTMLRAQQARARARARASPACCCG
jgi:hypothetical protein